MLAGSWSQAEDSTTCWPRSGAKVTTVPRSMAIGQGHALVVIGVVPDQVHPARAEGVDGSGGGRAAGGGHD